MHELNAEQVSEVNGGNAVLKEVFKALGGGVLYDAVKELGNAGGNAIGEAIGSLISNGIQTMTSNNVRKNIPKS